jgi:hypothetical protein
VVAEPPVLSGAVVALALALKQQPPKPGKGLVEKENDLLGQSEGLARQGQWEQAREKARSAPSPPVRFRALLAVAAAAADARPGDPTDAEAAVQMAQGELQGKVDSPWLLLRLTHVALRSGLGEDRLQGLVAVIPARAVRGRARLALLRARLASARQVVDEAAADKIDPQALSHALAREELARHNVRYDGSWAKRVQGWEEPLRAFGSLGVALGLQGGE